MAWNHDHLTDAAAEDRALDWSVGGMREVTERLSVSRPADPAAAFTAVAEAVWWATIIDARLVRQYTDVYDAVLTEHAPAQRAMVEETLTGLRFVRNMMGNRAARIDFIGPPAAVGGDGVVAAWTWRPVPEPALGALPPEARPWEMTRYRAYEAWLAGRTIGEVFEHAAGFLNLAATRAADSDALAGHQ